MNPRHVARIAAQLDSTPWTRHAARYAAAWERNQTAGTEPDGLRGTDYTNKTSGEACNCDDAGTQNCPHGTPTERAALGRRERDQLDQWIGELAAAWQQLRQAQATIARVLDNIDGNVADVSALNDPPGCEVLATVDMWEPVHRRTDIDGRTWALGRWAYDFHRRNGRLPTKQERERYKRGERIRVPA